MTKAFSIPTIDRTIAGFTFTFKEIAVTVELLRLNDDAKGEIGIYHENGNGRELLKYTRISLLNSRETDALAKSLESNNNIDLDWHQIMTHVTAKTVQALRDGLVVENINEKPQNTQIAYSVYPLLPENEPTTLFGPGGKAKSLIADLLALLKVTGVRIPSLSYFRVPATGNVLFLDWERTGELHKQRIAAIKNALSLDDDRQIHYIRCDHPIGAMIESLVKKAADLDIALVIVDSQMAATAGMGSGRSDAEVSSEYYNCLRRFNCTTLTIDHTTKAGANGAATDDDSPFGSIVKYNRATSVYRIESDQDTESDIVQITLKHTKFNLGRRQKAHGIEIEFTNDKEQLTAVDFREFEITESEKLRTNLPRWQIYEAVLKLQRRPMECADIANEAHELQPDKEHSSKTVYDTFRQRRDKFASNGKLWSLVSHDN